MLISLKKWRDLEDGHVYCPGDIFPSDGREVTEERISELTTSQNKAGFPLIKAVPDPVKEKPDQTSETPAKPKRSRKKAE